jgi:hypothetical protein
MATRRKSANLCQMPRGATQRGGRQKPKVPTYVNFPEAQRGVEEEKIPNVFEKNKGKPSMEDQETQRCVVAFETEARRNAAL